MPLSAFSFPLPETRFIKAGSLIYKFTIRGGSSYSGEEVIRRHCLNEELEDIVRTVLGNLDSLGPFSSTHFNVFPYKKPWEGVSKVMCTQCDGNLKAYPLNLLVYLEKNTGNGKSAGEKLSLKEAEQSPFVSEPLTKRSRRDSPLEEAILKDLTIDLEAESRGFMDGLHYEYRCAGRKAREDPGHDDKRGTKGFVEPQQKSSVSADRGKGTPGEVHPASTQAVMIQDEEEEEEEEERENTDSEPGTPERRGILTRLASLVFPFSLFLRDP
ncbi:membrane-anchored junction protein isoform X2 [Labrus bergylta]|uniref:membrane-anchored junction protein isoform X2 n=1 Tax=Labrus bergylta TaxID=56723 RepID=UPI0033138F49